MNKGEDRTNVSTPEKYIALMELISGTENRLRWSELFCFAVDIVVLLFTMNLIVSLTHSSSDYIFTYTDLSIVFVSIIVGMSINVYWVAYAMRLHLKLKLRYFQAREIERTMNIATENLFSDEHVFFDPNVHRIDSRDKKEVLLYPTEGLTRMDGLIGAAKPRYFSWFLPVFFFTMYWLLFFLVLTRI